MIIADGAEHRRLRQGVSGLFTPSVVKRRWEPRVRAVVEELLAPLADGTESMDLIADFTKIPVIIVAEMLGVPEERHDDFRRWSTIIIQNLAYGHEQAEGRARMDQAIAELNEYMDFEIERHQREQPDDVLTVMVNMGNWSDAEIRSSSINLLLAGYDTTAKLMAECLVVLEQHPDQRRLLVEQPELIPNAIEEVLRWHGSSQLIAREVVDDIEVAGMPLKAGDIVYPLLIAANRDPARWPEPERFDVRREFKPILGQPHMGFGLGPHVCIGAPLARIETQVALETLLRLAPEYRLRDLDYGASFFVRGPERGIIDVQVPSAT
jgi:cytochrome P450